MSERIKTHEGASLKPRITIHTSNMSARPPSSSSPPSGVRRCLSPLPFHAIPRLSLDRSHGHNTTTEAGFLVPVFVVPQG